MPEHVHPQTGNVGGMPAPSWSRCPTSRSKAGPTSAQAASLQRFTARRGLLTVVSAGSASRVSWMENGHTGRVRLAADAAKRQAPAEGEGVPPQQRARGAPEEVSALAEEQLQDAPEVRSEARRESMAQRRDELMLRVPKRPTGEGDASPSRRARSENLRDEPSGGDSPARRQRVEETSAHGDDEGNAAG